ncbi:uncharacterized protein LOC132322690 [Haemorhous mexicanus]|uniref:uncharacterized protein LOC132322690 n=1 Tax=Haemorhous mexicanus TaxID=30427 RepID=UPI0028BD43BA|nr:uncharacterized protein LOC132322690 [Haemorhous mexicanus]
MRQRWGGAGRLGDVSSRGGQWRGGSRLYKGGRGQAERRHFAGTKGRSGSGPAREGGRPQPGSIPRLRRPGGLRDPPRTLPGLRSDPCLRPPAARGTPPPGFFSTTFLPPPPPLAPSLSEPRWSAAAEIPATISAVIRRSERGSAPPSSLPRPPAVRSDSAGVVSSGSRRVRRVR